jgi:hypothetical protein
MRVASATAVYHAWYAEARHNCLPAGCLYACLPACLLHVQFLRSLDVPASWCETTTMAAAKGGQLACLAWLKAHSCPMDVAACIDAAAKHEQPEVLQFLLTECMW